MEKEKVMDGLIERVKKDTYFKQELIKDPEKALLEHKEISVHPLETDKVLYRLVVIALLLGVVLSLLGAAFITFFKLELPEIFMAMGAASVGALAGLLAPHPNGS